MPSTMPANMLFSDHSLVELRDLYRSATIVVVPLLTENHGAGITVVREALSVGRPVIATSTSASINHYVEQGLVMGVPAGDPVALRDAILSLLAQPEKRRELSTAGRAYMESHACPDTWVRTVADHLLAIAPGHTAA